MTHDIAAMEQRLRRAKIAHAQILWGGFYICPTTGKIREALHGDDKVLCQCRRSNPAVPAEETERTGVHIIRFLEPSTAEAFVDQEDARR